MLTPCACLRSRLLPLFGQSPHPPSATSAYAVCFWLRLRCLLQAAAAATGEGSAQKKSKNHGRIKCRWWRCLSLTHPYSVSASLVVCRCQQKNIKQADRKTKWSAIATQLCEAVLTQQVSHTDCASLCIWLILSVCHVACASRLCLTLHLSYIAFAHIQAKCMVLAHAESRTI